ncbi:MAG: cation:proton antiporter [Pirellulales bacterium]
MTDHLVHDLLVILAAGLVSGVVCKRLRVPVLIGYIVAGALVAGAGLVEVGQRGEEIRHLAEAGVFLLLFAIGLEFSLDELIALGRHLVVGGSVQMSLVAVPVAGVLAACGLNWPAATLLASAVSFSSTVLVFKALTEWGQTGTPAGRRAIGILLFQDVALVPLLLVVPLLTGGSAPTLRDGLLLAVTSISFVTSIVLLRAVLAGWLIPQLARHRSPELMVLGAVVVLGVITDTAHRMGLPPAVGAFAAGLTLSGNRWTPQFDALVMPLRETFAVVFFVSLGMLLDASVLVREPVSLLGWLVALVVLKAGAATLALRLTRLSWRKSLATGIGLAHVGEFAFVLVSLARQSDLLREVTAARFVAVSLTSLMLSPLLLRFGLKLTAPLTAGDDGAPTATLLGEARPGYALVIGIGPLGGRIASHLETTGHEVCVIDRSPLNLHPFEQQGFLAVAGDAADTETLRRCDAERATLVVVCVPDDPVSLSVVRVLHQLNADCQIVVRCRYQANTSPLLKAGAAHVISEEQQAGDALLKLLDGGSAVPT